MDWNELYPSNKQPSFKDIEKLIEVRIKSKK
jgi:hypothetical protein